MNLEAQTILDKSIPPPAPQTEVNAQPLAPESQVPASNKMEVLIKREQQALQRERQAKALEEELTKQKTELAEKLKRYEEFEAKKKNPKEALDLLGLTYDELTQAQLNDGELPPQVEIKKLREEIETYKAQVKSEKDLEKEKELGDQKRIAEEREQKAITGFKSEIKTYLGDNAARYELIAFEAQEELVFDVIDEHYNRTVDPETGIGKVMSIQEAADKVEEHLEQKELKRKEVGKVKSLWNVKPKIELPPRQELQKPQPRTLTNNLSASQGVNIKKTPISDEERVQKAIAYARGLRP